MKRTDVMKKVVMMMLTWGMASLMSAQVLTVSLGKPGTLGEQLQGHADVRELSVSGMLNVQDFAAIRGLQQLERLNLRKAGNKVLPDSAFFGMKNLQRVRIPRKVKTVGRSVFEGCERLEFVELSRALANISDNMFMGCRQLDRVLVYREVTTIGKCAFMDSGIRHIIMPELLERIGMMAFANCTRLERMHLPKMVLSVSSLAFLNCTSLRDLYVGTQSPPAISADAFKGMDACRLHVRHPEFFRDREPWSQLTLSPDNYNGNELQSFDRKDLDEVERQMRQMKINKF